MVTVDDVRALLNMDETEINEETVTAAITRATTIITAISRAGADEDQVTDATLATAGYLSYMAHLDHMRHELPGSFDEHGQWVPVASVGIRDSQAKLQALAREAAKAQALIRHRRARLI